MRKIGEFLLFTCELLFVAMFFYMTTNNIYFIDGVYTDFSLYGWGVMFALLGIAFYKWRKGQIFWLMFVMQLVVLSASLDSWRFYVFGRNLDMRYWFFGILAVEILGLSVGVKTRNSLLIKSCLAVILLSLCGGGLVFPVFMSDMEIVSITGLVAVYHICIKYMPEKDENKPLKRLVYKLIMVLATSVALYFPVKKWIESPGIHFYEKPITEAVENVKVSIVVPVYNAEEKLERCLDSLRKQTLKEIEIICVNDGSTDSSGEILAKYAEHDKRFKIIIQKNQYIGTARNNGIAAARGEFVGFIDNDDYVTPNYYEELYKTAQKHNADIAISANVFIVNNAKMKQTSQSDANVYLRDVEIFDGIEVGKKARWFVWDKIYRRSFLEENNIKSSPLRIGIEDFYFVIQAYVNAKKIAVVHDIGYYWLRHEVTESKVFEKLSHDNKAIDLHVAVLDFVNNANVSDDVRQEWLKIVRYWREYVLRETYYCIKDEDKEIWKKRYRETFPDDEVDFDDISRSRKMFLDAFGGKEIDTE